MAKLLVRTPKEVEEIVEVYEGGGYFDESRVLHDERKNGPIDPTVEARVKAEMQVRLMEQIAKEGATKNERQVAKDFLKNFKKSDIKTLSDAADAIAQIINFVGVK